MLNKPPTIQRLIILYDDYCAFCLRCMRWLRAQPAYFPLEFIPLHSRETIKRFPELEKDINSTRFIVISDQGDVYREVNARLMCLYALKDLRRLSLILAKPSLIHLVDRFFTLVSENRYKLSHLIDFFDKEVAAQARQYSNVNSINERTP